MALQLGALREALLHPGDEARANAAAEEVAGFDNQIAGVRIELVAIRGEIVLLRWLTGTVLAVLTAVALRVFIH